MTVFAQALDRSLPLSGSFVSLPLAGSVVGRRRILSIRARHNMLWAVVFRHAGSAACILPCMTCERCESREWNFCFRSIPLKSSTTFAGSAIWMPTPDIRKFAKDAYYACAPGCPDGTKKSIQRAHARNWRKLSFPHWPLDTTVEDICETGDVVFDGGTWPRSSSLCMVLAEWRPWLCPDHTRCRDRGREGLLPRP